MADSIESKQPFISEEVTLQHIVRLDQYILGSELFQCRIVIAVISSDQIKLINLSSFSLHLFLQTSMR